MTTRETVEKFSEQYPASATRLERMKNEAERGYCATPEISAYLHALVDSGIITDRERQILYVAYTPVLPKYFQIIKKIGD